MYSQTEGANILMHDVVLSQVKLLLSGAQQTNKCSESSSIVICYNFLTNIHTSSSVIFPQLLWIHVSIIESSFGETIKQDALSLSKR